MSTDTTIAIGEMRRDPRSKFFPRALKTKFSLEQKRKLVLGKSITISNSQLKGTSRKGSQWHVIFLTNEQYAVALQQRDAGKTFKLHFTPLQREFNARYASGFFGDLWDGVKSAASTVYNTVKKGVNSKIGKAILKGVDVGVSVLSEGAIPVGLVSGVTGAVFADDPEPEPEPQQDLEGDVPDADYTPLPQIHPKTGQQYSFPAPPVRPNGQAYTNANPPPIPKLPPPSRKVSKHPPLPVLPAPILGSNAPQAPAYGGRIHNSQSVILSSRPRLGVQRMTTATGLYMPTVIGGAVPRVIQTQRGPRFHDGRKFVSEATFHQLTGSRRGKGLNLPQIRAF